MLVKFTTVVNGKIKKRWKNLPTDEAMKAKKDEAAKVEALLGKAKGDVDDKSAKAGLSKKELKELQDIKESIEKEKKAIAKERASFAKELQEMRELKEDMEVLAADKETPVTESSSDDLP